MRNKSDAPALIEAVKTPLGFFTLAIIVMEGVITTMALSMQPCPDRTFLIKSMAWLFGIVIAVVALIATFRPEALWGKRYTALQDSFAESLGVEMFEALDGYMSNFNDEGRAEAYDLLHDAVMNSSFGTKPDTKRFCEVLVGSIVRRAEIRTRYRQGVLRATPANL